MAYFTKHDGNQIIYRSWEEPEQSSARMRILVLKLDHVGDFWMSLGPLKDVSASPITYGFGLDVFRNRQGMSSSIWLC
ncbi:hypothetical protein NKJ48_33720, partial [Mesorhizobium sp. M0114]|uniref:hypothetical protein n=1 Tax=unclassified Mesorhizobium TaxID=325217 RepID=UPI0033370B01